MLATEALKEEHRAIKLMLGILEKICDKLDSGEKVNRQHLEEILDFIRTFVDRCHHGKEEDLLFPAMEKKGVPREGGPIGVMLAEHETGRDLVRKMTQGVAEYGKGDEKAVREIIANAKEYIDLLRNHIDKEDNILYAIADTHLSPEEQKELLDGFERVEGERIGKGKHEELHQLLHRLSKIYLNQD